MRQEKGHIPYPNSTPSEELYRFGADGNLRLYSYDRLFYSLYGYDAGTTRTYKYSMDLSPNWVNGQMTSVNFNLHNAMFYPNSYLNFNQDGHYTKHYYNGMERIASRLGDQNLSINVNDPELQDRKDWQYSLIRKSVVEITGYEFLPVGYEQDPDNPKPHYDLPHIGVAGLQPSADGIYYYHTNHLGSTCYVTDENASVVQGFLYAPFGEITNEYNSSFGNNVLPKYSFNAKELDEETGMYYYEARYMAPPVFISRDPLFEKYPMFSPYAYCANNPVKYIDPTGEEAMENDYEWKYNTTSGLLSHVSDKGGKDQQTVHCVSNIGNQEVLNETVSFNGQIEDMFDFSVANDYSLDRIIDGGIQAVGGLVTAVGGVAVGVSSFGLAIPLGIGMVGYGAYNLGTGIETIADGIGGGSSGNKYEMQEMIKTICSWAADCIAEIVTKKTDVILKKGVPKACRIASGIATLGAEIGWDSAQIIHALFPERISQLPKGATVTKPNAISRPHVGVGLMPY